jgi:hypothetical protein
MRQQIAERSVRQSSTATSASQLSPPRGAHSTLAAPAHASQAAGHSFGDVAVFAHGAERAAAGFSRREIPLPSPLRGQTGQHTPQMRQMIDRLGPGRPLDSATGSKLQQFSDVPLSDVRVHDDRSSHITASAIGSEAFTIGKHIVLGDPAMTQTPRDWLLAHEVAHTIQQHPRNSAQPGSDREREADQFAEYVARPQAGEQALLPSLHATPVGLAHRVIARLTQDLPGDLLLVLDVDDGDFVGGCVRAIVPHVGAKLIRKGVPRGAGNQIFNIHVGIMTNALGQSCVFFYESVSGLCQTKCFATMEELRDAMDEILDWLVDLVKQVLQALAIAVVIVGLVVLAYLIAQALVAALGILVLA